MDQSLKNALKDANIHFLCHEPMSLHTTFRIGGPADILIFPKNEAQILESLTLLRQKKIPCMIIGRGSNLLVNDDGCRGAVLCLSADFSSITRQHNCLICQSGASLAGVARTARDLALSGLEFACGIPGSIGGAVAMNAGAYGGQMSDVVSCCRFVDETGAVKTLSGAELDFSYRHSLFSDRSYCITEVTVKLNAGNRDDISNQMETLLLKRREKQPLEYPSAGSTFKRPQGSYASLLIDQCGLKGLRVGDAQVSEKHAGFIVNRGTATCCEVLELMRKVKDTVFEKTGFVLEPEVKII